MRRKDRLPQRAGKSMEKTEGITLYYTRPADYAEETVFQYWLPQMEEKRKAQILQAKNAEVRLRSLAAGALLRQALQEWIEVPGMQPLRINYGKEEKPVLAEVPEVHFNLSHSGDYVCCAVSTAPVGVDIQQYRKVKAKIAEHFYTARENQKLQQLTGDEKEREKLFFRMWSIKESYLKLTGKGLSQGLGSFEIDWENKAVMDNRRPGSEENLPKKLGFAEMQPVAWFWEQEKFAGYSVCVCSGKKGLKVEEKEIRGRDF